MTERSTARILLDELVLHGIDQIYCLPGVQNDDFYDALYDYRIRPIHTRHEQGAAYMALGAAAATGKPQVFCVVPGPGFLNATAALATAWSSNLPVLALVGQVPVRTIGKGFGQLHEIPDQLGVLRTLTKFAARVERAEDARAVVRQAFGAMLGGRPRPVGIEVPMDVWKRSADIPPSAGPVEVVRPLLDTRAIDAAAELLSGAKRPLIFAGGGAVEARDGVRRLAEQLGAPVSMFRHGHGVLDEREPLAITPPTAHRLWPACDVALAIGSRMQPALQVWGDDANLKLVRIDIDPEEMSRIRTPDVSILAAARDAVPALAAALARRPRDDGLSAANREHVAAAKRATAVALQEHVGPQMAFLHAIRNALPADGIFVDELTQVGYVSRIAFPSYGPRQFISSGYQGTLGWGVATALGVKAARPDKPVVVIAGDGGFLFTASELATAKRHQLGIVVIVFNDNAYGNVRRFQIENFKGRTIASDLASPDFVKFAESFGLAGMRVDSPATLEPALARAIASGAPTVIEVSVGDFPSPWKFIQLPKVRG